MTNTMIWGRRKFIGLLITFFSLLSLISTSLVSNQATARIPEEEIVFSWSEEKCLSNSTTFANRPSIDSQNHFISVAYQQAINSTYYPFFIRSEDAGQTWDEPQQLMPSRGTNPRVSIQNDTVYYVYDDYYSTYLIRSDDRGDTWTATKKITATDSAFSGGPKIVSYDDAVHVFWVDVKDGEESSPENTEIYYNRSLDRGNTWSGERRLTNALYATGGINIAIEKNNIHVLFSDERYHPFTFDIMYKRSTDSGDTWDDGSGNVNEDRLITTNITDHMVSDIAAENGVVHVVWSDQVWPGPVYYLYYRRSKDNGATWEPIRKLSGPGGVYNPDIEVEGDLVSIVWNDNKDDWTNAEIYYITSLDGGDTWQSEERLTDVDNLDSGTPTMSISNGTEHIAWGDRRSGVRQIYYTRKPDFPLESDAIEIVDTSPEMVKPGEPFTISCTATDAQTLNASMVSLYYEDVTGAQFGPVVASSFTGIGDSQITKAVEGDELMDTRSYAWDIPAQPNSGEIHYWFATDEGSGNIGTVPVGANWAGPYNTIMVQNVANMDQPHPAIGFVKNPLDVGINGAAVQAIWYNAGEGSYFTMNGATGNDGLGRPGWYQLDLYQNNWTIGDPLWINATVTYAGSPYAGQNFTLFASGDNILLDDDKEYVNITLQIQEFFELKWTLGWNIWSHPMIRSENASLGLADLPFRWFANEHWKDTSQVGAGDECTLVAYVAGAYVTYIYPLDNGTVNDVTVTPDLAYWAFVGESWFTDEEMLALPEQGILVPGLYVWRHTTIRNVNVNVGWNLLGWTSFNATFSATDVIMTLTTGAVSPDGVPQPELIANWTASDWENGNTGDMIHWEGAKGYTTFIRLGVFGQSTAPHDFPVGPGYGFWVYSEVGGQTLTYLTM